MIFVNTVLGLLIGMTITSDVDGKLLIVLSTLFMIYFLNFDTEDLKIEED